MKNFFRSTLNWFNPAPVEPSIVEEAPTIAEEPTVPKAEPPTAELVASAPIEIKPDDSKPEVAPLAAIQTHETSLAAEEPVSFQPVLQEPGRPVTVFIRGARHYANCPHCEASWSLRERLFDPRTGRALPPHAFQCPSCRHNVSVPADLNLRSIR